MLLALPRQIPYQLRQQAKDDIHGGQSSGEQQSWSCKDDRIPHDSLEHVPVRGRGLGEVVCEALVRWCVR